MPGNDAYLNDTGGGSEQLSNNVLPRLYPNNSQLSVLSLVSPTESLSSSLRYLCRSVHGMTMKRMVMYQLLSYNLPGYCLFNGRYQIVPEPVTGHLVHATALR
ncbi:hypothetical protein LSAT2_009838 [Lamellibrachia satsuma]|nr:hypothetical protein LSAT2_009838 [Lamellibrachia satsuma]